MCKIHERAFHPGLIIRWHIFLIKYFAYTKFRKKIRKTHVYLLYERAFQSGF